MTKVSLTLTNGRGFDSYLGYGAILKDMASIYPFNGPIKCGWLVTRLILVDTLKT